jgi:hypothetical protein
MSEIPDLEAIRKRITWEHSESWPVAISEIVEVLDYCSALRAALREARDHVGLAYARNPQFAQAGALLNRIDALLAEQPE